jgi:hypothetical protein
MNNLGIWTMLFRQPQQIIATYLSGTALVVALSLALFSAMDFLQRQVVMRGREEYRGIFNGVSLGFLISPFLILGVQTFFFFIFVKNDFSHSLSLQLSKVFCLVACMLGASLAALVIYFIMHMPS